MNREYQVNLRMSKDELDEIDRFVDSGDFDSRTEFIRFAIRKALMTYEPGSRVPLKRS